MYTYVRKNWREQVFPKQRRFSTFTAFWDNTLHDGILEIESTGAAPAFNSAMDVVSGKISMPASGELQLAVYEKIGGGAGQFAK
jgi:hypothetical protein